VKSINNMFCIVFSVISFFLLSGSCSWASIHIDVVDVTGNHIDHTYSNAATAEAIDYLVGNGSQGEFAAVFTAALSLDTEIIYTISAAEGKRIVLKPPETTNTFRIESTLQYDKLTNDVAKPRTGTLTFENLIGTAPTIAVNQTKIWKDGARIKFGFISTGITEEISFTAMNIGIGYSGEVGVGSQTYDYHTGSVFVLWDADVGTPDPGQFVTVVPEPSTYALFCIGL